MGVDKEALKEALLTPRLAQDEVELHGLGVVRVRALSRIEAIQVQGRNTTDAAERLILHLGMVDPAMSEAEAGRWQKASPGGEIEPVTTRIAELSGMAKESPTAAYKSDGG